MIENIKGLYKIPDEKFEMLVATLKDAMTDYPKLEKTFDTKEKIKYAVETTIRKYNRYNMYYGAAFSLDENVTEVLALLGSEHFDYTDEKFAACGVEESGYREPLSHLSEEDQARWDATFEELLELEKGVYDKLPEEYIYIDFFGVKSECQLQGRGQKILSLLCDWADEKGMPLMLFTNTDYDIRFYGKNDFEIIAETESKTYGFKNIYMLRQPKNDK